MYFVCLVTLLEINHSCNRGIVHSAHSRSFNVLSKTCLIRLKMDSKPGFWIQPDKGVLVSGFFKPRVGSDPILNPKKFYFKI